MLTQVLKQKELVMKAITFRRKTLLALMIAMFGFGTLAAHANNTSGTDTKDESTELRGMPGEPTMRGEPTPRTQTGQPEHPTNQGQGQAGKTGQTTPPSGVDKDDKNDKHHTPPTTR